MDDDVAKEPEQFVPTGIDPEMPLIEVNFLPFLLNFFSSSPPLKNPHPKTRRKRKNIKPKRKKHSERKRKKIRSESV